MVEQGRTEKLGRVWNKTNIIDNLYSWTRKLRAFDNRSPVKMWTDTILIALLLYAMTTSGQQTKRFVDCEKSQCVLPKSREDNFQLKNQTLQMQEIHCYIQTKQIGSKCVVDIHAVLTAVQTLKQHIMCFVAICLTPVQITFSNSQNATNQNFISCLYLRGHCSISTSDMSKWGNATDFRLFYMTENASQVNDNSVQMSNRSIPGLENIGTLTVYKAKHKKVPEIFKKYSWPRMAQIAFVDLQLTSIPKELKTTMPLLQSLQVYQNNLSKPPDFPWYNDTLNLPRGLKRSPKFDFYYEFRKSVSPTSYQRIFDLSFNMIEIYRRMNFADI